MLPVEPHCYLATPMDTDWPVPPIWPEDLPVIRELLTDEEYAALIRRLVWVLPDGPGLNWDRVLQTPSEN